MLATGSTRAGTAATGSQGAGVRALIYLALLGVVLGGFSGVLETLLMAVAHGRLVTSADVFSVALFYALLWGAVGPVLGAVAWGVLRLRRDPNAAATAAFIGGRLLFVLLILALVGAYVNLWHLSEMLSRSSLLFDTALLAGCVLLFSTLVSRGRRKAAARARSGLRVKSPLTVAAVVLVAVLVITALAPERQGRGVTSSRAPAPDVNVLLLVVDALRPDHLGAWGYDRPTSPTIDRLAREGLRFQNAYAQAPCTNESTATLVTSLYPSAHNINRNGDVLPDSCLTLMQGMQGSGYRTAILSANPYVSPLTGFGGGVSFFYSEAVPYTRASVLRSASDKLYRVFGPAAACIPAMVSRLENLVPLPPGQVGYTGGDAAVMNAALLEWIDRDPGSGFFAYLHYMEPHEPYDPPDPYDEMFDPGFEGFRRIFPPRRVGPGGLHVADTDPLPEDEFRNMVARYDGEIAYFDSQLGNLLDELGNRGLLENTLVVITADHGEEFFDHGKWGHSHALYEELVRVPLILWWPGRIEGGQSADWIVRHIDLMPTILGVVGATDLLEAANLEGTNLWPVIETGGMPPEELPAYSELSGIGGFSRSLRLGDMKVIVPVDGGAAPVMLFDLSSDPEEDTNLAPVRPELTSTLVSESKRIFDGSRARKIEPRRSSLDPATRDRLRSLGYTS